MIKLVVAFRSFTNAPKTWACRFNFGTTCEVLSFSSVECLTNCFNWHGDNCVTASVIILRN